MAPLAKRKALIIAGVVTLCAIIGAVVGIVIWKTTSSSSDDANNSSGSESTTDASSKKTSGGSTASDSDRSAGSNSSSGSGASKITSDPTKATFSLSAYAIGDWGTTTTRDSCCKRRTDHDPTNVDKNAEEAVGTLMGIAAAAAKPKPKVVIGHGDNFYWTGINDKTDQTYRFTNTFEGKFKDAALMDIPWVNVMGNHDYGGASYICEGTTACADATAIVAGLKNKFSLQADYKSPNNDRWIMEDHFYVHSIKDDASGVSIDIFNVDTNDADTHGALQICCQCYGYAEGDDKQCNNVAPGDKYCAGGSTDMYNACYKKFTAWGDESRKQLAAKVKASTATWKIVNSHYSPYAHYAPTGMKEWFDILKGSGVHLWMNGHTHGEKHDYSEGLGVHFVENGAGGGIMKESSSGIPEYAKTYSITNKWTYGGREYGFFSVTAGKEWLKLQYHTADSSWTMAETIGAATAGGVATKHCWYIPADGTEGKDCTSS